VKGLWLGSKALARIFLMKIIIVNLLQFLNFRLCQFSADCNFSFHVFDKRTLPFIEYLNLQRCEATQHKFDGPRFRHFNRFVRPAQESAARGSSRATVDDFITMSIKGHSSRNEVAVFSISSRARPKSTRSQRKLLPARTPFSFSIKPGWHGAPKTSSLRTTSHSCRFRSEEFLVSLDAPPMWSIERARARSSPLPGERKVRSSLVA
jgi:hypothetical protein